MVCVYDGEPGWDLAESVAYSPDGSTIATGFSSGTLIWDIGRDRVLQAVEVDGIPYALAYSPDGRLLAVGVHSEIALWDTEAEEVVATLKDHNGDVQDLAFSPDGSLLASASRDGSAIVWDMTAYGQPNTRKTPTPTETASASATPSVTPTPR
jgi:WD40 repeat protein